VSKKTETKPDEITEMEQQADAMLGDIKRKSEEAEAARGAINRKRLAPLRESLVNAKRELMALMPDAKRVHPLGTKYLAPGVKLHPDTRSALGRYLHTVAGLLNGGMVHACDEILDIIDTLKSDNPALLPLIKDRAAGALSNVGAAKESVERVLSIVRKAGPIVKTVAQVEVPDPHPYDEEKPGRIICNIPDDA